MAKVQLLDYNKKRRLFEAIPSVNGNYFIRALKRCFFWSCFVSQICKFYDDDYLNFGACKGKKYRSWSLKMKSYLFATLEKRSIIVSSGRRLNAYHFEKCLWLSQVNVIWVFTWNLWASNPVLFSMEYISVF